MANLIPAAAIAEANGETANFSAFGAATTLSRSTAFPGVGAVSLLSTYTGTGYPYIYPINPTLWGAPVTAGSAYSACITAQLGSGTTGLQGGSPQISWYDINGNYLSNTAGSYTALSASVATQLTVVNATAPTSAAFAIVQLNGGQSVAVGDSVAIGKLGIFAGATVPAWTAPPVTTTTGWLTKSGTSLQLAGAAWRAAGADMYYLGLDDNIRDGSNNPTYPTHYRIDNVMATAKTMGFTIVRSHTLGISTGQGQAYTFMTGLNTYNPAALESIDYAIASAARHGIRLVIPLTDQYRYYHGGKWNFVHNRAGTNGVTDVDMTTTGSTTPPTYSLNVNNNGTEKANEAQFYTNTTIISDFEGYIARLLNHVNVYTGISLGADPTCAIWETGNEIYDATAAWTDTIAAYIKTQAPNALVSDGSAATGLAVSSAPGLSSSHVDIVGSHYYPPNTAQLTTDLAAAAGASKVFAIGEYDWTGANGGPTLAAWEAQMAGSAVAYDAFWTLLPYEENGTAEPHTDGYQFWNPAPSATGGSITQAAMTTAASAMTTHAAAMSAGTGGSGPSFPIADPAIVDAVNSGSLAVRLIAIDSFFGTPAAPTVPTCIQYVNGTQNQPTVVLPNVTQAGNCLVACVVDSSSNEIGDTAPPSGTGWQMVGGDMNNPGYGATQYLVWPNHPGGIQSQTWNLGLNGGTRSSVTIAEFSGMPPALAVDQYVEGPPTSNNYTYTFAGTPVPAGSNELILSGVNSGPAVTIATTSATPNSLGNDSDNNFFAWGRTGTAAISQTVNVNGSPSHSGFIVLRAAIESVTP
jgi:hypothetical protein